MTPRRGTESTEPKRLRLLVVDDGLLVTPPLLRALTQNGFSVQFVADPSYALTDTRGRVYDAVLINSDFAGVDALWLCRALRVQGCLSVIIILTGARSKTDQLAAWRAGATDRVARRIPRQQLVERLLAHIDGTKIKVTGLMYPITAELPTTAGLVSMSLVPTLISLDEHPIALSRLEERLFARLWAARGAAVSPDELMASLWLSRRTSISALRVHVHQLRRKRRRFGIVIERGGDDGYRISSFAAVKGRTKRPTAEPRN
jgi:DNA-binding response OmpR family regulator